MGIPLGYDCATSLRLVSGSKPEQEKSASLRGERRWSAIQAQNSDAQGRNFEHGLCLQGLVQDCPRRAMS